MKDDEEDWKLWPQFQGVKDLKTKEVVAEVHGFAQTRRDEAEKIRDMSLVAVLSTARCAVALPSVPKSFKLWEILSRRRSPSMLLFLG